MKVPLPTICGWSIDQSKPYRITGRRSGLNGAPTLAHVSSEYISAPTEPQKTTSTSDIAKTKIFVTAKLHNLYSADTKTNAGAEGWYRHKVLNGLDFGPMFSRCACDLRCRPMLSSEAITTRPALGSPWAAGSGSSMPTAA
jgi:hypothetical protein